MDTQLNLNELTSDVCEIARSVGGFIRDNLNKIQLEDIQFKGQNSLVSFVDQEAEKKIVQRLKELLPVAGFVTEEDTVEQNQNGGYEWIVDPLDGTTNYLHKIPVFAVSIALRHKEEILIGVVYNIMMDECFSAWKDGGAFLNQERIQVSGNKDFSESLIATGFPYYDFEFLEQYLSTFKELISETRGVRRLGAAAVDLAYVACGRFDGFFEYSLHIWDIAAGELLVKEAGGLVTDFEGGDQHLTGSEIIATNPYIYRKLKKIISRQFALHRRKESV
ncbi:MAG: inositol monophosphatase [Bacteroidia bacterium]|nr:inositol monophosphatase [Bacteroidia bacterium]